MHVFVYICVYVENNRRERMISMFFAREQIQPISVLNKCSAYASFCVCVSLSIYIHTHVCMWPDVICRYIPRSKQGNHQHHYQYFLNCANTATETLFASFVVEQNNTLYESVDLLFIVSFRRSSGISNVRVIYCPYMSLYISYISLAGVTHMALVWHIVHICLQKEFEMVWNV